MANAVREAKAAAHLVTRAAGGRGAVREVVELILKAQGKWDAVHGTLRGMKALIHKIETRLAGRRRRPGLAVALRRSAPRQPATRRILPPTEYYEPPHQQQVKSILSGAEAPPQPGGLLIIKQLKLRTFGVDGTPEKVVTAPECIYDTLGATASSAGPLQLQNVDGKFLVEGEGFLWRQTNSLLTISNNVRTLIEKGAKSNLKP